MAVAVRQNTIRAGYRHTDVGVLPNDWDTPTLGDLFSFKNGLNKSKQYFGHGTPIVNYMDVYKHPGIYTRDLRGLVSVSHQELKSFEVRKGDVFFTRTSETVDEIGVASVMLDEPRNTVFSGFVLRARPKDDTLDDVFKKYCFAPSSVRRQIIAKTTYTTRALTNGRVLSTVLIARPGKHEQRAIAGALSVADALIVSLDQLLAKKRDIKQGAMQQLLTGKTRLPGFASENGFKKTELGVLPKEWTIESLARLVDPSRSIRYGIVQPGTYDPNGRYMIRGQDYSEAKGWANPSKVFRVSPKIEERYRNARVKQDDLIMTIVGYCGHVEMVPDWLDGANLTQTTARIAIKSDRAISTYCKYVLQSDLGKNQVAEYIKGAAQPGLNCGDVEKFLVSLPSLGEQEAIAAVLTDMDGEIAALEVRRDKARALKQGMMQQLLTGSIRLV